VAGNNLCGHPDAAFNSSSQTLLRAVDISSNDWTGPLPSHVFSLPNLESFASIKTCFSGSLPSSICECSSLSVLLLDGVTSGAKCQRKFSIDALSKSDAYVSTKGPLKGGIPACIWTKLPLLKSLHLGSNGLTGYIMWGTDMESLGSNLSSIVLSYNQLSGTIPNALLSSPFTTLELSNNRFKGTIDGTLVHSDAVIYLQNNRLSGFLSASYANASGDISIMQGNLIDCNEKHHKPAADAHSEETSCGSSDLDDALLVWGLTLCIGVIAAGVAVFARCNKKASLWVEATTSLWTGSVAFCCRRSSPVLSSCIRKLPDGNENADVNHKSLFGYLAAFVSPPANMFAFFDISQRIVAFQSLFLCLVTASLCIPLYAALKFVQNGDYSTHTYQYRWLVSATFLTGRAPALAIILLWALTVSIFVRFVLPTHSQTDALRYPPQVVDQKFSCWRLSSCFVFAAMHFVVMSGINASYLYIILSGNYSVRIMTLAQLGISAIKVLWDSYVIPAGLHVLQLLHGSDSTDSVSGATLATLKFICSGLSAIVIPFIVSLLVNSLCFLDLLIPQSVVNENFFYSLANRVACVTITVPNNFSQNAFPVDVSDPSLTDCLSFGSVQQISTDFYPPFTYSFQCGSSILTSYVPVLIYSFTMKTVLFVLQDLWNYYRIGNTPASCGSEDACKLINNGHLLSSGMMSSIVLLTFGIACPSLAVVVVFSTIVETVWFRYHFLVAVRGSMPNGDVTSHHDKIVQDDSILRLKCLDTCAEGLWRLPQRCLWTSVHVASVFWALMVFDMIGDTDVQHPQMAWSGPFIVCILPLIIRLCGTCLVKKHHALHTEKSEADSSIMPRDMTASIENGRSVSRSVLPTRVMSTGRLSNDENLQQVKNPIIHTVSGMNSRFL
jgi:hypothetical protein